MFEDIVATIRERFLCWIQTCGPLGQPQLLFLVQGNACGDYRETLSMTSERQWDIPMVRGRCLSEILREISVR